MQQAAAKRHSGVCATPANGWPSSERLTQFKAGGKKERKGSACAMAALPASKSWARQPAAGLTLANPPRAASCRRPGRQTARRERRTGADWPQQRPWCARARAGPGRLPAWGRAGPGRRPAAAPAAARARSCPLGWWAWATGATYVTIT